MWTRQALEARVDKLAAEHEGEALVEAVVRFSEQLGVEEREVLGQVLLERAPARSPKADTAEYPRWRAILPRIGRAPRAE